MKTLKEIVDNKGACSLPWLLADINLHNNVVRPCCKYEKEIVLFKNQTFSDIWTGEEFNSLRKHMINGEKISNCNKCHISDNIPSYKDKKNKDFANMFSSVDLTLPLLPKVFHIGLTNICNLACRMCQPAFSSKLDHFISKSPALQQYYPKTTSDNLVSVDKLAGSFANATHVLFVGGEPMVDTDCLEILKMIRDESTKLEEITFVTNLTRLNHSILKVATSTNAKIILSVSIDGPPSLQEYIRHFSKWGQIYNNMAYIRKHYPNIKFGTNSTISTMNIGYVTDTIDFLHKLETDLQFKFLFCNPSLVLDKTCLWAGNIPNHIKNMYLEKITQYKQPITIPGADKLLESAIGLLKELPKENFQTFIDFISNFDKLAKTDYLTMYPEFKSL